MFLMATKAEADASLLHGEAGRAERLMSGGSKRDAAAPGTRRYSSETLSELSSTRGQQRRHVLPWIVALEVRRLIGHHRVGNGVSLVEGVVGEVEDLIVDLFGRGVGSMPLATQPRMSTGRDRREETPPAPLATSLAFFLDMARRSISACPSV